MNVLIDTNIILDVMMEREPWLAEAGEILGRCEVGSVSDYLQASVITDIFYIVKRTKGSARALKAVDACLRIFTILSVDRSILEQARLLPGPDFEDNVQIACALAANLNAIVTRDPAGFAHSAIPAMTPRDLLTSL